MNNNQWIYYQPVFECDQYNPDLLIHSPWAGHRNFAYDYVCNVRPSRIVELGSYYGCSSFAFLQAIKDQRLDTVFYAVDTWGGDAFTVSDYQEDIFGAYSQINKSCFSGIQSHMLRKTFDEACADFADGSIDLLHIDGSHHYEDVKNDFTRWRSKVAANGVVFFHDVGRELLLGKPMGSHIFWQELKTCFQFVLEFPFSNGLGVLFFSEEAYRRFLQQVDFNHYQLLLNLQDTENKDIIRKNHFTIRDLQSHNAHLQEQIVTLNHHLNRHRADQTAAAAYQQQLQQNCDELQSQLEDIWQQLCAAQESHGAQLVQFEDHLAAKERYIQELEDQVAQLNVFAASKEDYIRTLEQGKQALADHAAEKDTYSRELEQQVVQLNGYAADKDRYSHELEQQIVEINDYAAGKDRYSRELEQQIAELNDYAAGKDRYSRELELQIAELNEYAAGKDRYSRELEQQRAELADAAARKDAYAGQLGKELSEARSLSLMLESRCNELHASLAQEQACRCELNTAYLQCCDALNSLIHRIEKLPFGKYLLKGIPSIGPVQEEL